MNAQKKQALKELLESNSKINKSTAMFLEAAYADMEARSERNKARRDQIRREIDNVSKRPGGKLPV